MTDTEADESAGYDERAAVGADGVSEGARRDQLMTEMDREGRRLGFHSTMHNHACAALAELHRTDWEILDLLGWAGTLTAGELAGHLGLSRAAITGAIDRLEERGFVRRRRDGVDRRRVLVEAAHDRDGQVAERFLDLNRAMVSVNARFTDDELALILDFMRGASAALEASTHHARAQAGNTGGQPDPG